MNLRIKFLTVKLKIFKVCGLANLWDVLPLARIMFAYHFCKTYGFYPWRSPPSASSLTRHVPSHGFGRFLVTYADLNGKESCLWDTIISASSEPSTQRPWCGHSADTGGTPTQNWVRRSRLKKRRLARVLTVIRRWGWRESLHKERGAWFESHPLTKGRSTHAFWPAYPHVGQEGKGKERGLQVGSKHQKRNSDSLLQT